jgi:preprotein translocase subunit Sec61beta
MTFFIFLEANDEFLRNRVMNLPESVVHGTHNTETELNRRLTQYRNNNDEENTVLTYFDEREIDPIKIDVTKDESVLFFPFLVAIALSVILQFTASDYPFGIFKLFLSSENN